MGWIATGGGKRGSNEYVAEHELKNTLLSYPACLEQNPFILAHTLRR